MTAASDRIEGMHHDIAEAVKTMLGKSTIVVTVSSMNDRAPGQWLLGDPDYDRATVAARLRLCADILTGRVMPDGSECEATPEAKLEMLADECRKALRALDAINLERYFAEFEKSEPDEWARTLLAIHDHLRPALNVLGLDYHKE